MPIHEYECRACGHHFEFLSLPSTTAAPQCPECQGTDLERLLSGFAVTTRELSLARVKAKRERLAKGRDFKDQQVAEAEFVKEHIQEHFPPKD